MQVESAKGECNPGQHEIAFQYNDALTTCDNHVIYKTGAKEIAAQQGSALTFMAKYNEREGNSCHIHLSLRTDDGAPVFAGDREGGVSAVFEHFVAGQLAALRELSYFFAPNINSYKRFQPGSVRADRRRVGVRQPHLRDARRRARREPAVREPAARRRRQPLPRCRGDDRRGAARRRERPRAGAGVRRQRLRRRPRAVPSDAARGAPSCWQASAVARAAFGDAVVDHYVNAARVETRRVRRSGHRLGARPRIRADVSDDATYAVINPANEQVIAGVARTTAEADRRGDRAARSPRSSPGVPSRPGDRARLLRRFADAVDADRNTWPSSRSRTPGHTISNARWEAGNARDVIAYYSARRNG